MNAGHKAKVRTYQADEEQCQWEGEEKAREDAQGYASWDCKGLQTGASQGSELTENERAADALTTRRVIEHVPHTRTPGATIQITFVVCDN